MPVPESSSGSDTNVSGKTTPPKGSPTKGVTSFPAIPEDDVPEGIDPDLPTTGSDLKGYKGGIKVSCSSIC